MKGIAILLLIVIFFCLIWPVIARWLKKKAMERMEDYVRSSMGMPPRDKKKRATGRNQEEYQQGFYQRKRRNPFSQKSDEPLIPKEYAEDVEFTETIDYSSTEYRHSADGNIKHYHESQISDAEWTEIKTTRSRK